MSLLQGENNIFCQTGSKANNLAVWGTNFSFVCKGQEYNLTAACMCDQEIEIELDAESSDPPSGDVCRDEPTSVATQSSRG